MSIAVQERLTEIWETPHTLQEHEPVDIGGGHTWVIVGGFTRPAVILATVFIIGLSAMSKFPMHDGMLMPAQIRITGHQWWWTVQYLEGPLDQHVMTANEIHIPAGTPVDIDLASTDVIHSFWVPSLHGKVDLIPGMMNRIRIEADRPGTYCGQCAEYCGEQHAHMILLVVAQPPNEFQRWLADQRRDGQRPQLPNKPTERSYSCHVRALFAERYAGLWQTAG